MQREMLDGSRRAGMAERLLVRVNGRALVVDLDTLDRVEAVGAYVRLHMGKQVIETRRTLRAMRSLLDPSKFCQVHRSTIVRLDRIRELQPYFHGDAIAILSDGTRLRVSRERRARLEAALGGGDSGQGE
jgi:two-component system LytT family response regulator